MVKLNIKLLFLLISLIALNLGNRSWAQTSQNFSFSYNGPDTIFVGNNCTGILNWGAPANPVITPNIPGLAILTTNINISGGFQVNNPVPSGTRVTVTYTVTDVIGGISTFSFTIDFVDNTAPVIDASQVPQDVTLTCGENVQLPIEALSDNCTPGADLMITTQDSPAIDFCSAQIVERIYTVSDAAGNLSTITQTLHITPDNIPPVLIQPASNRNHTCNDGDLSEALANWIQINGQAVVTDNCPNIAWSTLPEHPSIDDFINGELAVTFIATDPCGNQVSSSAIFRYIDTEAPTLVGSGEDLLWNCDGSDLSEILLSWVADRGNLSFIDNCLKPEELTIEAFIEGISVTEIDIAARINEEIMNGCADGVSVNGQMVDQVLIALNIVFRAIDLSGNFVEVPLVFAVKDISEPQWVSFPQDIVIECEEEMTIMSLLMDWIAQAGGAMATDDCGAVQFFTAESSASILEALSQSQSISCGRTGSVTVEFILSDFCGNLAEDTYQATFTVQDTTPPIVIRAPVDITLNCTPDLAIEIAQQINQQLQAEVVDACSEVEWTSFTWVDSNGNTGESTFSDEGSYPFPNADDCSWFVTLTMDAEDACGNSITQTGRLTIEDTTAPTFLNVPPFLTVSCDAVPPATEPEVSDNCRFNLQVTLQETSTQEEDSTVCGHYQYTISRIWTAMDACGNSSQTTQTIEVIDDQAPMFGLPALVSVSCTADITLDTLSVLSQINDNCSPIVSFGFSEIELTGVCVGEKRVERRYMVSDVCGNTSTFVQNIFFEDNEGPEVLTEPQNLTISCAELAQALNLIDSWVANQGGAIVEDECSAVQFFAAIPGTYQPSDPTTFPGQFIGELPEGSCGGEYLIDVEFDFVFFDACNNVTVRKVNFRVLDEEAPQILACPIPETISNTPGQCEATFTIRPPIAADQCFAEQTLVTVSQSRNITSASPGSNTVVVDPVVFQIPLDLRPGQALAAPLIIEIRLENVNGGSPTRFFNIFDEQGVRIGQTNAINNDCGNSTTTLQINNLSQINNWAADGIILLRLVPNRPAGQGVNASIRDICGNSIAHIQLTYAQRSEAFLQFSYAVGDMGREMIDPDNLSEISLPVGSYAITYFVTDCFGNESSCQQSLEIIDAEPPVILCGEDVTHVLHPDSCSVELHLSLPEFMGDNCGPSFEIIVFDQTSNKVFLPFNYDTSLDTFVFKETQVIINEWDTYSTFGTFQLQVEWRMNQSTLNDYLEIWDENGNKIGDTQAMLSNQPEQGCANTFNLTFDIDGNSLRQWQEDGQIIFNIRASSSSVITPCDTASILVDGDFDGVSFVALKMSKSDFRPSYRVTGATTIASTILQSDTEGPSVRFNPGISIFQYILLDRNGNSDTCSIRVEVIDSVLPIARCQNAVIQINPSGTQLFTLDPGLINDGSTDNCEIQGLQVIPETFDCNQVGLELPVVLLVTDTYGNSSSCTSIVRVERTILLPIFNIDICNPDTLKLFTNLPEGPGSSSFTYQWTGPNGFISNQENPVLTNINSSFSGTYQVRITGFGGCFAEGLVTVIVPEVLGTPALVFGNNPVCEGSPIFLETEPFSANVQYKWYMGRFPDGMLLATTAAPGYSLLLGSGEYEFYVIAESPNCVSPPSVSRTVTVLSQLIATVDQDLIELCAGEQLQLSTPNVGVNLEYQWSGPSGFISSIRNPIVSTQAVATNSGIYTLQILQSGCPSTIASVEVFVKPIPAQPILVANEVNCPGDRLILSVNNVSNGDQYFWQVPDGSPINTFINQLTIENITAELNGMWSVIVEIDGCQSTVSVPIVIDIEQQFSFEASNDGPVCNGDSIVLTATALPGGQYSWIGPTSNIASIRTPIIVPASGIYSVTGITQRGCVYEAQTMVAVITRPQVTALSSTAEDCEPGNRTTCLQASILPMDPGNYTYLWSGPGGYISMDATACISNTSSASNGVYTLQVTNTAGCASLTSSITLSVKDVPDRPTIQRSNFYCEIGTIELSVQDYGPGSVYIWTTPTGVVNLSVPSLVIQNATSIHEGAYFVSVVVAGCTSPDSESITVSLRPRPVRPSVSGDNSVCEGDSIRLNTPFAPGASFAWTGPNGFASSERQPVVFPAGIANEGNYLLTVTVDGCTSLASIPFFVRVIPKPLAPRLETSDPFICAQRGDFSLDLCIQQEDVREGVRYRWFDAFTDELIGGPLTARCFNINDLDKLRDGNNEFYVIAQSGSCFSDNSVSINVRIDKLPDITANAGNDLIACNQDEINVQANSPAQGNGQWIAIDNFLGIEMETSPSTSVFGLRPGVNQVIWSLNYRSCLDYSRDTLLITYQVSPETTPNNYVIPFAGSGRLDFLSDDILPFAYNVDIVAAPQHGSLVPRDDNSYEFIAFPNYVGEDQFVYRVCATGCPGLCSESVVLLQIGDESICDIPNIITPNNDGINDIFFIPCLSSDLFPQNKVMIFNEWGTAVFEEGPYSNTWNGTYRGQDLPIGTYFYVVEFGNGRNPEKGFLIIKR